MFLSLKSCVGRHGSQGYIPNFKGLDSFQGTQLHSSRYKYPAKHDLDGKRVVIVGTGNSGMDFCG